MSRSYSSYDADWQRRKSILIRSLFHDIPILSPVEEESSDSYNVPNQEVFASPPRPYSPLPPLIIEKVPITNKHDEPEEHYTKLYKKIKSIYTKLFIENLNFSSIDYDSNYNDSSVNDDSDGSVAIDFHVLETNTPDNGNFDSIIEDREARESSASTKSNGYGADFETMDTAIIDVVNYTTSNEIISEEEESDNENNIGDGVRNEDSVNSRSSENKESSRERVDDPEFSGGEDSHHSIIDDHEMIESEETHKPEDQQSYEKEGSDNENFDEHEITEETSQTVDSDTLRIDDHAVFSVGEESHDSSTDDYENTESEESNVTEDERQSNNIAKSKQDSYEEELKSKNEKTAAIDESNLIESNVESMEGDVETSDYSEGPVYRQITTSAMVHFDGSEDAGERESRVYEDSAKSVILPTRFRRMVLSRNVDVDDRIEVLSILEENADTKTVPTFYTDESETTDEDSEGPVAPPHLDAIEMLTPQADTPEKNDEGMCTPRLNALEEDDEEMSTPRLDAPEADHEEMSTPRLDAPEADHEEMSTPRLDAPEADHEEMSTSRLNALEEDDEEMSTPRLNAPEKMRTSQPESAEDVEGMRSPQRAARDEETEALEALRLEEMGSPHPIEQMRTPRPDLSHGTIPITHRSNSESTSENTAVPQEPTTLTSSTQDGADHNMSEIQTSNDMNEILTSIFNESRNKEGTPISVRKRKLVDKSVQAVQTSRVTWEDMRANFFVGTPKIFRLCACTDHICY